MEHNLQHDYISDLLNPIPLATTWEIAISLSVEIKADMWFIIIDRWINMTEERMMYHRKNANTVYVYSENRVTPRHHSVLAKVILDTVGSINYAHDNWFDQMYIFRKSENDVIIKWGPFFINKEYITLEDLDTETSDQNLSYWQDNYIYIKDNAYIVTTDIIPGLYPVWIISVEVSWSISKIQMMNVFPIGHWITESDQQKLNNLDSSKYEKNENKTNSIRPKTEADNTKYPTEKAIANALYWKVDKVEWKWLSKNDLTDDLKWKIDEMIQLDLPNSPISKPPMIAGPWILIEDLWDAWYRFRSSTSNAYGTAGEHIDIFPVDSHSKMIHTDEQKYVVLEDWYRSWFYGNSKFKDAQNPAVTVFYNNPNNAGTMVIDTHIRVVNGLGMMTETHKSIPYQVNLVKGHWAFELSPESFAWLDYINSVAMYIKVNRVWAFITDHNGSEFNTEINDLDSVVWPVRIKSMFMDYEQTIELPQAWYAYEHDQFVASDTWNITHWLWTKKIIVQCYNAGWEPIQFDTYSFTDNDTISIKFSDDVSWSAVILSSWGEAPDTSGDDKNFEEVFTSVTGGWVFTHWMWKYPCITVIDSNWKEIIIETTHQDKNIVSVTWTWTHTGRFIAN